MLDTVLSIWNTEIKCTLFVFRELIFAMGGWQVSRGDFRTSCFCGVWGKEYALRSLTSEMWKTCGRKWGKREIVGKAVEKIREEGKEITDLFYLAHLEFSVCFCGWHIKLERFSINIFLGSLGSQKNSVHTWLELAGSGLWLPPWDGTGVLWLSPGPPVICPPVWMGASSQGLSTSRLLREASRWNGGS